MVVGARRWSASIGSSDLGFNISFSPGYFPPFQELECTCYWQGPKSTIVCVVMGVRTMEPAFPLGHERPHNVGVYIMRTWTIGEKHLDENGYIHYTSPE